MRSAGPGTSLQVSLGATSASARASSARSVTAPTYAMASPARRPGTCEGDNGLPGFGANVVRRPVRSRSDESRCEACVGTICLALRRGCGVVSLPVRSWGGDRCIRRAGSTGWRAAIAIIRFALAVLAFLIATGACLVLFVKWNARYERFRVRGLLLALIAFLVVLGLPLLLALRYPY